MQCQYCQQIYYPVKEHKKPQKFMLFVWVEFAQEFQSKKEGLLDMNKTSIQRLKFSVMRGERSKKTLVANLFIITIILKMNMSKQHFLFVLISSLIVRSQVLAPTTYCLGECLTCDPLSLTHCQGQHPCDWGFYQPAMDSCIPTPSTQIVSSQLPERSQKSAKQIAVNWGSSSKVTACEYISSQGKKFLDVLGFYSGVQMLEKSFQVDRYSQVFELSFNLIHDEWLPFNDFLIIDISSGNENLQTLEISYDRRVSIDSQALAISCGGKRVLSQKFSLKIQNNLKIGNTLTVLFTSFLYSSVWGITNIRLSSGCIGYSLFDSNTQKCNKCDLDSFVVSYQGTEWCEKCPKLCQTCSSSSHCLTCVKGAAVNEEGICAFDQKFKTQVVPLGNNTTQCSSVSLRLGSSSSNILFQSVKNDEDLLYDQIQIGFFLFYFPLDWTSSADSISVRLNGIEIMSITAKNLTSQATDRCIGFRKGRVSFVQIFSDKIVHTDNVVKLEFKLIAQSKDKEFGVGEIRVKSIKKQNSVPAQQLNQIQISSFNSTIIETQKSNKTVAEVSGHQTQSQANVSVNTQQGQQLAQQTQSGIIPLPTIASTPVQENNFDQKQSINETSSHPTLIIAQPSSFLSDQASINGSRNNNSNINLTVNNKTVQIEDKAIQTNQHTKEQTPSPSSDQYLKPIKNFTQNKEKDSSNIAFLPACNDKKSGIHIFIKNQSESGNHLYSVSIDKLNPDEYEIDSYFFQGTNLNMFINIQQSFTDGVVSIYRYSTARLLQNEGPILVGNFKVQRFDYLSESQISSVQAFSVVFTIAAWIAVIIIIVAVMSGYGVVVEEYVTALQLVFLHAYIASDYLPLTFRDSIGGLSLIQNLNFFLSSHGQSIEHQWMGNVLQTGPVRFYLFNTDINFLRQFYPVIIINIVYFLWFICLYSLRYYYNLHLIDQQKNFLHKAIDKIAGRTINFVDQIWRYQFLTTLWFCFIQFYNFNYPQGSNRSAAINAIICILAFLCTITWPILLAFICRKEYYEREYSEFLYFYEDSYYLKIPQYELPSNHHRVGYPTLRAVKLFLFAFFICYFGSNATFTLLALISINICEILYIKWQEIYVDQSYFKTKVIQNSLFLLVDIILLCLLNFSSLAVSESYVYLGYTLAAFCLLIIANGLARIGLLTQKKYLQAVKGTCQMQAQKRPRTERAV